MFAGDNLSNSKYLFHFILVCILYVLLIIEWAFQLSFFNKMNPYYGKGGPMSKTQFFVTLFVWIFNLVGFICLTANIIIYFIVYYLLIKKGKDTTSLLRAMDVLAKVCFGFIITSAVFGFLIGIVAIIPELGCYSEDYETGVDIGYDSTYENKYTRYFLSKTLNTKMCSFAPFEMAYEYGKKLENLEIDYSEASKFDIYLITLRNFIKGDFSPLCNGTVIPMLVFCFLVMIYGSVCKCAHKNHSKDGVANDSSAQQYPNQQGGYPNQSGMYPNQPGMYPNQPGMYPNQQGGYPNQPGMYPNQQGGYPNQPGAYPNQQGGYPNQPAPYPNQPATYQNQPTQDQTNQQEREQTPDDQKQEVYL